MPDAATTLATTLALAVAANVSGAPASNHDWLQRYLGDTRSAFRNQPPIVAPARGLIPLLQPLSSPSLEAIIFGPPENITRMHLDRPVQPWGPEPFDRGGLVDDYQRKVRRATHIAIRGTCISACTMLLGARNVCVDRDAMFWFHSAYVRGSRIISPKGNRIMSAHWPRPVREWAESVGATERIEFTWRRTLMGFQLIAMGIPACPRVAR